MLLFCSFVPQVYREIRQALVDMETMFALQSVKASIVDAPDAKPLELTQGGNIDFEDVCFSFKERNILKGAVRNNLALAAGLASGWITRERKREGKNESAAYCFSLVGTFFFFRLSASPLARASPSWARADLGESKLRGVAASTCDRACAWCGGNALPPNPELAARAESDVALFCCCCFVVDFSA